MHFRFTNTSWKTTRPTAEFLVKAVGQAHGIIEFEEVEESGGSYDMFSSVKGSSIKSTNLVRKTRSIEIAPLTDILLERNLNSVGIMSIDIEGHEYEALLGLDLDKINVEILIIENNAKGVMGNDLIREYLTKREFKFIARIWDLDDVFICEDSKVKYLIERSN
jgi:FkbM family methyltransferase